MNHSEGTFTGARDATIYYQTWTPEGKVRAALFVVHGLGEHSGRYMNVVNHLVPLGYAVYGYDHIGHGRSDGIREFVDRFDDYTSTLTIYCNMVKGWQAGKPLFLIGHSMGGLIAACHLLDHQSIFKGAIISAPIIKVHKSFSQLMIFATRILSIIMPTTGVMTLNANNISRDPQVVDAYINDPLVFHGKTSARLSTELLKTMHRVMTEAGKIDLPLIILQGSADKHVDPAGAQMLFDKVRSRDKTMKVFEGLHHELFNEPEHTLVLNEVETWLAAHV